MTRNDIEDQEKIIFYAARQIEDADQRKIYLDATCGTDEHLRHRIDELIAAASDESGFLGSPKTEIARSKSEHAPGCTIGHFKLLEQIGEGGFGVVYMAQQVEPIRRRVAFKIIKAGMDTKQVVARFEAERQALALMDHPNIANVLDAGTTELGRPYFVMELVRGIPVTDYCAQRKLSTRERLELFTEVCRAIEHAHQKGIIHRDIKPSNVLVYQNGERALPKVIDFGIAKATQGNLTERTLFTQFQQFIGTPAYMSPEQAQMSGVDVDTRSDIYSLGVLLYELLTGKTPLDISNLNVQAYQEACRRIREEHAPRPSKRVSTLTQDELSSLAISQRSTTTEIASRLRGDLDWIVMKALEKDRSRRYQSTDGLIADIGRHLRNEPVHAGPPSVTYHFRKFIQRNRTAVLMMLAIAASLVLGTAIATMGWLRAVDEKQQTELATEEAHRAKERAEAEKEQALTTAYLADMQAAHQALRLHNLGMARQILGRNSDFDSDLDPRHWEWRALWWQCQGNAENVFGIPGDLVKSLSIAPESDWVAASGVKNIRVWEISTGKVVHTFEHGGIARFSPDGDVLYTTNETGAVRSWHVPSYEPTDFVLSHGSPLHDMQVAPDGTLLATFGKDGDVVLWDAQTREAKQRIPSHNRCSFVFSSDSSKLALGGPPIRIIDLQSMNVTHVVDKEVPDWSGRAALAFSSDGKHLASAHGVETPEFMIHRVVDGERIARLREHSHETKELAYSPDGTMLASASLDQRVLVWDTSSLRVVAEFRGHELGVITVAFSPGGQRLLSGGSDGKICVWNLADVGKENWPVRKSYAYMWNQWRHWPQVSCSPDGGVLATTYAYNMNEPAKPGVTLRSTGDLQVVRTLAESSGIVRGVLYSPVENLLVISNQDGALEFITPDETRTNQPIVCAEGKRAFPVRFTPDGKRLLVVAKGGGDTACAVYSASDQSLIASWAIPEEKCATISPDGELIVTGHADGLRFWPLADLRNPTYVTVGNLHKGIGGLIWSVDFSPDGAYVAAGTNLTGRIEIVDALAKRPVGHLAGHVQHVGAVRFSPDGKRLASGGHTGTDALKLWDFESRREIMSLAVDGGWSSRQVEWLPDGNSIMLLNGHSQVSIWRAPSFEEIRQRERQQDSKSAGMRDRIHIVRAR